MSGFHDLSTHTANTWAAPAPSDLEARIAMYETALHHIANTDDNDCKLTERDRIQIARSALRVGKT